MNDFDPQKCDIFFCHSSKDKEVVEQIFNSVRKDNDNIFFDKERVKSDSDYHKQIRDAVKSSKLFVLFSSKHSHKADYCLSEIGFAMHKEGSDGFSIINVSLDPKFTAEDCCASMKGRLPKPFEGDLVASISHHIVEVWEGCQMQAITEVSPSEQQSRSPTNPPAMLSHIPRPKDVLAKVNLHAVELRTKANERAFRIELAARFRGAFAKLKSGARLSYYFTEANLDVTVQDSKWSQTLTSASCPAEGPFAEAHVSEEPSNIVPHEVEIKLGCAVSEEVSPLYGDEAELVLGTVIPDQPSGTPAVSACVCIDEFALRDEPCYSRELNGEDLQKVRRRQFQDLIGRAAFNDDGEMRFDADALTVTTLSDQENERGQSE